MVAKVAVKVGTRHFGLMVDSKTGKTYLITKDSPEIDIQPILDAINSTEGCAAIEIEEAKFTDLLIRGIFEEIDG